MVHDNEIVKSSLQRIMTIGWVGNQLWIRKIYSRIRHSCAVKAIEKNTWNSTYLKSSQLFLFFDICGWRVCYALRFCCMRQALKVTDISARETRVTLIFYTYRLNRWLFHNCTDVALMKVLSVMVSWMVCYSSQYY